LSRHAAIALLATLALVAGYPSVLVAAAQTTCQGAVDAHSGAPDHTVAHSVHATLGQSNRRAGRETMDPPPVAPSALVEVASSPFAPRCWPLSQPLRIRAAAQPPRFSATAPRGPPAA
jgi:hypothetical protein